jgi:hypothetical protein
LPLRIRWAIFGALAGVCLAAFAFFILRIAGFGSSTGRTLDAPSVVQQVQRLSELVSVKYTIQKAIGLEEQKVPLGSEKLLLFVQAEVLAGIDLSQLAPPSVKLFPDKQIQIALPPPKIIRVVIDDKQTKVWDRRITWWTPWVPYNPDLERQARLAAKEAIEQSAIEMGILDQAKRNAELSIRSLLEAFGAKSVIVGST